MTAGGTGEWVLGVIGGSGLYEIEGLTDRETVAIDSPWGAPSDALVTGRLDGVRLVFLPRHGVGHRIPPGSVNARANIDVLKRAGCTDLLSISAVGSLREELAPGAFVVVDQFIDRTVSRPATFFDYGVVAHVSMADPVCPRLSGFAAAAAREAGAPTVEGGVYVAVEGPQFSTRAESELYRSWGAAVIGMTAMPEARLAREAELPYASVCMVTDYDCWRAETAHVEVAGVLAMLKSNAETARDLIGRLVRALPAHRPASAIDTGLDFAVVTDSALWPSDQVHKLAAICPRKFGSI